MGTGVSVASRERPLEKVDMVAAADGATGRIDGRNGGRKVEAVAKRARTRRPSGLGISTITLSRSS